MKTITINGREYPSQVSILSRIAKIEWVEGKVICEEDSELVQGTCDYDTQVIKVNRTLEDPAVAEVLWHEMEHFIHWMWENEQIEREEEDYVNHRAITFITVARQNPGLLAWTEKMANP